jgi:hypothetical protein
MNLLEAQWLQCKLAKLPSEDLSPLLNVGCSTLQFRTVTQPYIDELVFRPLCERGCTVVHTDIKDAPGVDLVGDLCDATFRERIRDLGCRSALVSNLLEHVPDPAAMARAVMAIVPPEGYIIVSGPRDYPYHPDPLDNGWRPSIDQVHRMFPGTQLVDSAIIDSGNWRQWRPAERGGRSLPRTLLRLAVPFYRPAKWLEVARAAPFIFKHITAFALILRRTGGGP